MPTLISSNRWPILFSSGSVLKNGACHYWIPKSMKQMKLFFEAEKIPPSIIRKRESLDHDRIIRAMADLGDIFFSFHFLV